MDAGLPLKQKWVSPFPAREEAASNLLAFTEVVDTKRVGEPSDLTLITANWFAQRRKDGVNVIPIGTLSV